MLGLLPARFIELGDKADFGYYKFMQKKQKNGEFFTEVKTFEKGQKMFDLLPKIVKLLVNANENVIIDDVLFSKKSLDKYLSALKPHKICLVGVYCNLKIMRQREILRGNRCLGLSENQSKFIHKDIEKTYDLTVDTTHTPPFELAKKILDFVIQKYLAGEL